MNKIKFLEDPKFDQNQEKRMFPEMFNLTEEELTGIKGGKQAPDYDCDAYCYPSEHGGGNCSCKSNLA
jgi:hypothetical protein